MAQAGAVVDVVGAEPGAHELLKKVGLFVAALGRAEAGECVRPERVADLAQALAREAQRFVPARFTEYRKRVAGVESIQRLGHAFAADQGRGDALPMMNIVEAVSALH